MDVLVFDDHSPRKVSPKELPRLLAEEEAAIWVDMTGPTEEDVRVLLDVFGFHPLAVEDTRNQKQRPKAEEFPNYLVLILNPMRSKGAPEMFRELDVFIGQRFLVTVHPAAEPTVEQAVARLDPSRVPGAITTTMLLYTLIDVVIDGYFPVLDRIEAEVEQLGQRLVHKPDQQTLDRLFMLQRALSNIWHVIGPQQAIMTVLTTHPLVFIDQNSLYYLRDLADHLARITDTVRTLRDMLNSMINLYASAVSNQLNRDVNRLTLLAVAVAVLTVIGGFYGMNFERTWPPFDAAWGVPVVIVMMLLSVVVLMVLFRWWLRR